MFSGPPTYEFLSLISHLAIDWLPDGARVFVRVFGEVDISTAPRLAERIRRAAQMGTEVVIDLEGATFMDCAGLGALLQANSDLGPGRLSVTPGPPQVQRLFEFAGITRLLRVAPRPLTLGRRAA
jgi:anti-anti-sigma factor